MSSAPTFASIIEAATNPASAFPQEIDPREKNISQKLRQVEAPPEVLL